jgi:hypothetical protein
MRSKKGSRRIVIQGVEYRWRATGNDGYISIGIWPSNNIGPFIKGNLRYHETPIGIGGGAQSSPGDQIVVTNRIIKRIIEHAVAAFAYDPQVRGKELNLKALDEMVEWRDAIRGSKGRDSACRSR